MDKVARVNKALRTAGDDFLRASRLAGRDCQAAERTFARALKRWKAASRAYAQVQPRFDQPGYHDYLSRSHGRAYMQAYEARDALRQRRCKV